jgi:hypothetical protein
MKTGKMLSVTLVVGTHGNQGFGYTRKVYAGRTVESKAQRLPIALPAWAKKIEFPIERGYTISAFGLAYAYVR